MLKLPQMKYTENPTQKQVTAFRGLNWTDNTAEGDFADGENLSSRRYPFLTQRLPRSGVSGYTSPTSVFAWDGKLIVVDGTTLYYDGVAVGTVATGGKQFAVVNTKLCIWPDKKYLDLTSKKFGDLDQSVTKVSGTNATFTANSIKMDSSFSTVTANYMHVYQSGSYVHSSTGYLIKKYTAVEWTAGTGWTLTGETEVAVDNLVSGHPPTISGILAVGDIVMLKKSDISGNYALNTKFYENFYDEGTINYGEYADNDSNGYYAVITETSGESLPDSEPGLVFWEQTITFQVLNALYDSRDLTTMFANGDRVQISGCSAIPANNTAEDVHLKISTVTADTITFSTSTLISGTEIGTVVVRRALPALDYICESENRLWGVSSEDKTIFASSLGDPKNFYVYDDLSTDSYAVAVGSEGDFTGIFHLSNAVLCWKENSLHKVLGSYPAEYQVVTYRYPGVQDGCSKSLVNINEVLYYMSRDGAYAYAGSAPTLISEKFGSHRLENAVSGTDGVLYYLSAEDDSARKLLTLDTRTGFWMQEDDTQAVDFCRIGATLYLLDVDGKLWKTGQEDGTEVIEWSAQLTPFWETIQGKKRYSRMFLRVELPKGSRIKAEYRCDGGIWQTAGAIIGKENNTAVLPVVPRRCDKFEIKISGKGPCAVLQLLREFRVGSEV